MNRFEEDYNNLNTLYEKYLLEYGGNYTPRMAGGQQAAQQGSPSYPKGSLPLGVPGNGGNAYAMNQGTSGIDAAPVVDEEMSDETHISKVDILAKIDEMIDEASSSGMDYAVYQLASLKFFISQ